MLEICSTVPPQFISVQEIYNSMVTTLLEIPGKSSNLTFVLEIPGKSWNFNIFLKMTWNECPEIYWKYSQKKFLFMNEKIIYWLHSISSILTLFYLKENSTLKLKYFCVWLVISHVLIRGSFMESQNNLRKSWTELRGNFEKIGLSVKICSSVSEISICLLLISLSS